MYTKINTFTIDSFTTVLTVMARSNNDIIYVRRMSRDRTLCYITNIYACIRVFR